MSKKRPFWKRSSLARLPAESDDNQRKPYMIEKYLSHVHPWGSGELILKEKSPWIFGPCRRGRPELIAGPRPAGSPRPIQMAPKPCVSKHFCDFCQNDGNEGIPCPKRGAEQTFQRSAHQENLVPGNLCSLMILHQRFSFSLKWTSCGTLGKQFSFQTPRGSKNWKIVDSANCLMKNNFFFKRFGNDSQ